MSPKFMEQASRCAANCPCCEQAAARRRRIRAYIAWAIGMTLIGISWPVDVFLGALLATTGCAFVWFGWFRQGRRSGARR